MSSPIKFDPPQPADLTALLPGYEVHDLVATGGMGAVYRATHVSLDRTVAIKVLPEEFADESFRDQFQAEARAMAKLNHSNLIGIYDFGTTSTKLPFIVMEFVAGKSLYYSAYQKAIEEGTAVRIVKEICEGLAQAHKNNIVHRDIKPANILMDPDAHAKIGDFGLASHTDTGPQHSSDDVVYGTPGYAAPEIIHNPAAIGKPSDIFAVGAILYELLTGHLPDQVNPKPASRIANSDPRLDRVIRKAMHSNPAMRYQDASEMSEDLNKITATPVAAPRGTGRLHKRTGPVQVQPGKRSGPVQSHSPTALASKSGRIINNGENTAPILSKPKKITGRIAARTSEDYKENSDLSSETRVSSSRRRRRPKDYKGPQLPDPAAPVRPVTPLKTGTNWSLLRNLVIIALLIPAIYFAWTIYQQKQKDIAAKNEKNRLEQLAEREKLKRPLTLPSQRKKSGNTTSSKNGNTKKTAKKTSNTTEPVQVFGKNALEQLAELKDSLANGARSRMPDGTIARGTTFLLPVDLKMTWSAANQFAEEHGAYLAAPTSQAELSWLADNLPSGMEKIWIGGGAQGETNWGWVTGEKWNFRTPSTELGSCALLTSGGAIKARPNASQFPFFLEWNKDGTNSSDIASQLERLKKTLNSPNPQWPPGTFASQTRHYYFVQTGITWEEADLQATASGGHLMVCSDPSETSIIREILQEVLKPGQSTWLGGFKEKDEWTWSTGEPFLKPQWIKGAPNNSKSNRGLRFICQGNQSGWDNANPFDARSVDGYLIEWSKDGRSAKAADKKANTNSNKEIAKLQKFCRKKLTEYILKNKKVMKDSSEVLEWSIISWFNKLPKRSKDKHGTKIEEYKAAINRAGMIPRDLNKRGMPARVRQLYSDALEGQDRFDKALEKKNHNLRNSYLERLIGLKEKAQASGQGQKVSKIDAEIRAIGQNASSFRKHFKQ